MATVYDYPSSVIGNAPRANVGIVPFNSFGYDEYFAPKDPRIKDHLGYSAYDKIQGVPQLGISDQLVPKQIKYDRPEELEFAPDPNAPIYDGTPIIKKPIPAGIYNTELNPYDPSSKFFPREQDLAGIMGIKAYEQQGQPVLQKDLGETSGRYRPFDQEITINPLKHALKKDDKGVPQLELNPAQDPDEVRNSIFHEGKHFFIDKFGNLVPKVGALSDEDQHKIIWFANDLFTPGSEKDFMWSLNKKQAEAWTEMQDLARKWSKNQTKFTGGIEKGRETWERLIKERSPNVTYDQAEEQYDAYRDPKRGDVQTPTMTQQEMVQEAQRTGGTVNPHEATKAVYRPSIEESIDYRRRGKAEGGPVRLRGGGIVGLDMPVSKPSLFQKLFDYGRNVASMQLGGGVTGAGTGKSDSIPAMLSDGEFVMTAKSVKGMGGGNREKGFKKLNTMMKSAEGRAV